MKSMKLGMIWVLGGWDWQCSSRWGLDSAQSVAPKNSTDPVFVGAGDIAGCGAACTGDQATAKLLHNIVDTASSPTTVFTTGDNAYDKGTLLEYNTCYGPQPTTDPNWGEFKAITKPSPGNHEYETAGASRLLRLLQRDALSTGAEHTRQPWIDAGQRLLLLRLEEVGT